MYNNSYFDLYIWQSTLFYVLLVTCMCFRNRIKSDWTHTHVYTYAIFWDYLLETIGSNCGACGMVGYKASKEGRRKSVFPWDGGNSWGGLVVFDAIAILQNHTSTRSLKAELPCALCSRWHHQYLQLCIRLCTIAVIVQWVSSWLARLLTRLSVVGVSKSGNS